MSCKYCSGTKSLINTRTEVSQKGSFYHGIEAGLDDGVLVVCGCADVYEPNWLEAEVKINYCPMCGKKLTTNESEKN